MKKLLALLLLAFSMSAQAIDLREYFPTDNTVLLNQQYGNSHTRYKLWASPSGLLNLYTGYLNLNKPGYHYGWKKEYWVNGAWCLVTYGVLFMGDDLSVTEVGDWYSSGGTTTCAPNVVFGYRNDAGVPVGLGWSPPGGLTTAPATAEMNVWRQNAPGQAYADSGYDTYSRSGVVEVLPTYTPPYGRDSSGVWRAGGSKTYADVVRIVMYHGTRAPTPVTVRCEPPIAAWGPYYQSFKNYNSYAIELYLAKGVGIIQEGTPFIEDGAYWGVSNCNGTIFGPYSWTRYIDLQ